MTIFARDDGHVDYSVCLLLVFLISREDKLIQLDHTKHTEKKSMLVDKNENLSKMHVSFLASAVENILKPYNVKGRRVKCACLVQNTRMV